MKTANERKAWLVTMIIVVMFTMILTLLFLLEAKVMLMVAVGSLSAIGLSRCATLLHNWLAGWEEDELDPVEIREDHEPEAAPSADVPIDVYTYDQIREELGGGKE